MVTTIVLAVCDIHQIPAFQRISSVKPGVTVPTDYPYGDVATDHYHRYDEDVALMKDLGRWNFLSAYTRQTLPAPWNLAHPTRVERAALS